MRLRTICIDLLLFYLVFPIKISYSSEYIFLKTNSPYYIKENYEANLKDGDVFKIEAGVEINLAQGVTFIVNPSAKSASITIEGDSINPIKFKGIAGDAIVYIRLLMKNKIEYVHFENIKGTINAIVETQNVELHHLSFNNCNSCLRILNHGYYARQSVKTIINHCMFKNIQETYCINLSLDFESYVNKIFIENSTFDSVLCPIFEYFSPPSSTEDSSLFVFRNNTIKFSSTELQIPNLKNTLISNNLFHNNNILHVLNFYPWEVIGDFCVNIVNNTFYANNNNDGALLDIGSNNLNIANCIFWNNSVVNNQIVKAFDLNYFDNFRSTNLKIYNCILPGKESACSYGKGSFQASDLFEFDPLLSSDFKLNNGSSAIDAGFNVSFMNDQDGSRNDLGFQGGNGFYILPDAIDFGAIYQSSKNPQPIIKYLNLLNMLPDITIIPDSIYLRSGKHFSLTKPDLSDGLNYRDDATIAISHYSNISGVTLDTLIIILIEYGAFQQVQVPLKATTYELLNGEIKGRLVPTELPYCIDYISICEGDTLIIDPGVRFFSVYKNCVIDVKGTLFCGSESGTPVEFISSDDRSFSIIFTDGSGKIINAKIDGWLSDYAMISLAEKSKVEVKKLSYQNNNFNYLFYLKDQSFIKIDSCDFNFGERTSTSFCYTDQHSETEVSNCRFEANTQSLYALLTLRNDAFLKLSNNLVKGFKFTNLISATNSRVISINNIISDCDFFSYFCDSNSDLYFVNNTVYNIRHLGTSSSINYGFPVDIGTLIIRNNIYYPSGAYNGLAIGRNKPQIHTFIENNIIKGGESFVYTGDEKIKAKCYIFDNYFLDPVFVESDTNGYGFHLKTGSPGIDQGHLHPLYFDADTSPNDIGSYGGTGKIPPVIWYDAFFHLSSSNINWIIETVFNLTPFSLEEINLWNVNLSQKLKSFVPKRLHAKISTAQLFLPKAGEFYLEHVYTQDGRLFSEMLWLIIGSANADENSLSTSSILSLIPSSPNNSKTEYAAWQLSPYKYHVKVSDAFNWQTNPQSILLKCLKTARSFEIHFISDSTGQEYIIPSSMNGDYYQCEFQGNGIYILKEADEQSKQKITIPNNISLLYNHPNPFNNRTTIIFKTINNSHVKLLLYDALGQQIALLFDGNKESGIHQLDFNANAFASGIYYLCLKTDDTIKYAKIALIK